jgi:hypothetical protein
MANVSLTSPLVPFAVLWTTSRLFMKLFARGSKVAASKPRVLMPRPPESCSAYLRVARLLPMFLLMERILPLLPIPIRTLLLRRRASLPEDIAETSRSLRATAVAR